MSPTSVHWRWEEQDFGFRFRAGSGPSPAEHYQAAAPGDRYFTACEAARIHKDYAPLAALIEEWEAATLVRWEGTDGAA